MKTLQQVVAVDDSPTMKNVVARKDYDASTSNITTDASANNEEEQELAVNDNENQKHDSTSSTPSNKTKTSLERNKEEQATVQEGREEEGTSTSSEQGQRKPMPMNILILYPDDWRHDSIGSEKPYVLTPFLDQLAREGIRFTHNAVTTSVCWMSRATLWMGQYTSRHKSYKLKCPRFSQPDHWNHSWVSMIRNAGYFVAHIGKWQYPNKIRPLFDWMKRFEDHHWYGYRGKQVDGATLARIHAYDFFDQRPKDKPFSLSIAFYPPKPVGNGRDLGEQWKPTNATRTLYNNVTIPEPEMSYSHKLLPKFLSKARGPEVRWDERYRTSDHYQASMKNYYALITGVDQACKEIVDRLKQEGLYNNTMIIFTTDNGMMHGAHGLAGKWYPYQESIRVPLIIYDPRMPRHKVGMLDDSFTLNVDLAETILGAAGIKPDALMQGRDISDLYLPNNEKNEYHDTASVERGEPWRNDYFYEFPFDNERFIASSTALVTKEWKYIHWTRHQREQLFHLTEDPLEFSDLYNDNKTTDILKSMRQRHNELRDTYHEIDYLQDTCFGGPGLNKTSEKTEK